MGVGRATMNPTNLLRPDGRGHMDYAHCRLREVLASRDHLSNAADSSVAEAITRRRRARRAKGVARSG